LHGEEEFITLRSGYEYDPEELNAPGGAFRFRYEYTLDDMNALSRVTAKTYRRKKTLVYRLVCALLGVGYLALGLMMIPSGQKFTAVILVAAGLFFSAIAIFFHKGAAWRSKRMLVEGLGELTAELEETGIRGKSQKAGEFYPYDAIIGAYHYRGRYFLFLDKKHAVLLPETGLVEGDSAALKDFLERKLGMAVVELR